MPDERLVSTTRERIRNQDYEAVFAHGGCFHFALRLSERFRYNIRGIREGPDRKSLSHVWCQKGGDCKGIDIRGVYPEELLVRLANGGDAAAAIYDVVVDELRATIREKGYPADLEIELSALADRIVNTHERFQGAHPSDESLYAQFVENIEGA